MEESRRTEKIPFDVFLKRSWPLFVVGAVLVLAISVGLLIFALSGNGRKQALPVAEATSTVAIEGSTSTNALVPRALDGVLVEPTVAHLLPFAVMIDNSPDARPSLGVAQASLVFEAPVEGGLTRYMAVFDASTTVDRVGPVRSARPYFVDFADSLGALYAHVGGSPDALSQIAGTKGFRNADEMANGSSFWRSKNRVAPHNVYTRSDLLQSLANAKRWYPSQWHSWDFKDDDSMDATSGTARGTTNGPKVLFGGSGNVAWTYDRETNRYLRSLNGAPHVELDGTRIKAKNVIVILTDASVTDAEGRLKVRTTGRGKALLYRDGHVLHVYWRRVDGGMIQLETVDGMGVSLDRGMTWIEVITSSTMVPDIASS